MKQKLMKTFACLALMAASATLHAQEPKGQPVVTLFGDYHVAEQQMGFNLERAYLGYQHSWDEKWTAKVVFDMGKSGDVGDLQRLGYLKNAFVSYKSGGLQLNVGLASTEQFNTQEKHWGYRYVSKSFMDEQKWGSSADLGLSAKYTFAPWMSADLSIFNGEGYKKLQLDDQLLYGLGLTLHPAKGLTLRAYGELKPAADTACQQTLALFAGYKHEHFSLGAEWNMQHNQKNTADKDASGLSLYATGKMGKRLEAFLRYDNLLSHTQQGIVGLQWKVNKQVSLAPNFRWTKANDGDDQWAAYISAKFSL